MWAQTERGISDLNDFLGREQLENHQPRAHNCTYKEQWHTCAWNPKGIVTQPVPSDLVTFLIPWSHLRSSNTYPLPLTGPDRRQRITPGSVPGGSDSKRICNARDPGLIPALGRNPGEGNGYPLQYSCLGNPIDRRAWRVTVHGVAKSRTQLSDDSSSSHNWLNPPDSPSWGSLTSILLSPCSPQWPQFRPPASHLGCCNHSAPHHHGAPALSLPWSTWFSAVTRVVSTWCCSQAWTPQCSFMV